MLYLESAFCIICIALYGPFNRKELDVINIIVLSCSCSVLLYCTISLFLFAFDIFSFQRVLLIEDAIVLSTALWHIWRYGIKVNTEYLWIKKWKWKAIICVIALMATWKNAELFDMGQDEGVYQNEAIYLATGHYSIIHDFEEYNLLNDDSEKAEFKEMIDRDFTGFYFQRELTYPVSLIENNTTSEVSGVFHGLHTYSAFLGLWGLLFGLKNMMGAQSFLFVLSSLLFCHTLENLAIKKYMKVILSLLFVFSPLMLWISKTAYSEILRILSVDLFLVYVTVPEKKTEDIIGMAASEAFFIIIHVVSLLFYPLFWVIHLYLIIKTKKKQYSYSFWLPAISLAVSACCYGSISTQYYYDNLSRLFIEPIITRHNILFWIIGGTLVSLVFLYIIPAMLQNTDSKLHDKWLLTLSKVLIVIGITYGLYRGFCLARGTVEPIPVYSGYRSAYLGKGVIAFLYTSVWALTLLSGLFILPATICKTLFIKKEKLGKTGVILTILFSYMVCLFGFVLKSEVYYYFYYARYFSYLIPIILIQFAGSIQASKEARITWLSGASLLVALIFSVPVLIWKDDTLLQWRALDEIVNNIQEDSAIIIDRSITKKFGIAVKAMSDADIFPLTENLTTMEKNLLKHYSHLYLLCDHSTAMSIWLNDTPADDSVMKEVESLTSQILIRRSNNWLEHAQRHEEFFLLEYTPERTEFLPAYIDLEQDVYVRNGNVIDNSYVQSNGEGGVVIYGPYVDLTAGSYQIHFVADVAGVAENMGSYELTVDNGIRHIGSGVLTETEESSGEIDMLIDFDLDTDIKSFELVIILPADIDMKIYPYSITIKQ